MTTKGRTHQNDQGYVMVRKPDHPRSHNGYVREHILVAEAALGRSLPESAEIHHVNEDPADNRGSNLVICEDKAYHKLLHRRMRALAACGHADWELCEVCGKYDDPANLTLRMKRPGGYHRACAAERARERKQGRGGLPRYTPLRSRGAIKQRNPERLARLEEQQFGQYGLVVAAQACWVSGMTPVDRAHVLKDRSVGGGPEGLAPLHRLVHTDFGDGLLSDAAFQKRWGVSRADIRARAISEYAAWLLDAEAVA